MTTLDITEAEFQQQVIDLAHMLGYQTNHVRRSIGKHRRWTTATSTVGWPDLTLWRPGRFLMAELKSATGRLTPEQADVLDSLRHAGIEAYCWRPADLDQIASILNRPSSGVAA